MTHETYQLAVSGLKTKLDAALNQYDTAYKEFGDSENRVMLLEQLIGYLRKDINRLEAEHYLEKTAEQTNV